MGSSHVVLRPGAPRCGRYVADTKTAGSCTLMVQVPYGAGQGAGQGAGGGAGGIGAVDVARHVETQHPSTVPHRCKCW